jgi:hypothetical protein
MNWTRRTTLMGLGAACATGISGQARAGVAPERVGLDYLENLGQPGALNPKIAFIPPSRVDRAYSHVVYVNTALRGEGAQKMWVTRRKGQGWELALWDDKYWDAKGAGHAPDYSWPVSTGRVYPGNRRSGPTPVGIFNVDDRSHRHRRGWGSPGMYNSIYIDLHYGSGRAAGIAMHGTTRNLYRRLGRVDSHGCIRMQQKNADLVWSMFHGKAKPGPDSPLWTEAVPRYFTSKVTKGYEARRGYVRDGSFLYDAAGERLSRPGYSVLFEFFRDDL